MKKRALGGFALMSLLLLVGGATPVAAAEGDQPSNQTTTKGSISFQADDSNGGTVTEPGDPGKSEPGTETPVDPGDPGENGGGSTTGPLRLVYVPNIDFGSHKIKYSQQGNTYYAKYQTVTEQGTNTTHIRPSFFVVSDLRGGTDGWNVTLASDGKLTNESKPSDQLDIVLSLQNFFASNSEGFDVSNIQLLPSHQSSASQPYLDLVANQATVLASAPKGSGAGTTSVLMGTYANKVTDSSTDPATETNPAIKLFIPAGKVITQASYSTTLTWTINSTL